MVSILLQLFQVSPHWILKLLLNKVPRKFCFVVCKNYGYCLQHHHYITACTWQSYNSIGYMTHCSRWSFTVDCICHGVPGSGCIIISWIYFYRYRNIISRVDFHRKLCKNCYIEWYMCFRAQRVFICKLTIQHQRFMAIHQKDRGISLSIIYMLYIA